MGEDLVPGKPSLRLTPLCDGCGMAAAVAAATTITTACTARRGAAHSGDLRRTRRGVGETLGCRSKRIRIVGRAGRFATRAAFNLTVAADAPPDLSTATVRRVSFVRPAGGVGRRGS